MSRDALKAALEAEIACHDAQPTTTPLLSRIRNAAEALLKVIVDDEGEKRDYRSFAEAVGPFLLTTKRGSFLCQPTGDGYANVEVRQEHNVRVEGAPFCGTFTLKHDGTAFRKNTDVCYWGMTDLTSRREKMMIEEVCSAVTAAAAGPEAVRFRRAERLEVSNNIWREQKEIDELEGKIATARSKMRALLAREAELGDAELPLP